jgi:hypothetical protein
VVYDTGAALLQATIPMLLLSVLHKVDAVNCDVELRYRQWSVWGHSPTLVE